MEDKLPRWLAWIISLIGLIVFLGLIRECWIYTDPCESSWREQTRRAIRQANPYIEHCRDRRLFFR